ncbi:VOC family protein [Nocardioides sp. SOB77]|uniref:VOC family protein n=1 Tax=Nocardioides oceani TaxID=3058369 RepID=A0ABT8FEA7_9ACTN|nr:VOC family protein [Nocardioides oceani]MDN4172790.1 VOC family protein [Nocardioides oceani]
MTSRLTETVVDCHDPVRLADFWCAALGWVVVGTEDDGSVEIGPERVPDVQRLADVRAGAVVPTLLLQPVPEGKTAKNRLHLDLSPVDCSQADEVERLLGLGATRADVGQDPSVSWVVLADPEGNELCVLRSLAVGQFTLP